MRRLQKFLHKPVQSRKPVWFMALFMAVSGVAIVAWGNHLRAQETAPAAEELPVVEANEPEAVVESDPADEPVPADEPDGLEHVGLKDVDVAKRAASKFLRGYLPYTYGRGNARDIKAATAEVKEELAANPPRVPARYQREKGRIQSIQTEGVTEKRAAFLALVKDGQGRYSVSLELAKYESGWLVTRVGD